MELEIFGYSNSMVRESGKLYEEVDVLCSGLNESGERQWSAEKCRKGKFWYSDSMIRVSVICMIDNCCEESVLSCWCG